MLFAMMFAFWRFLEILTLVSISSRPLPPQKKNKKKHPNVSMFHYQFHPPCLTSISFPDTNNGHASLLRRRLRQVQPAHTNLHPDPLHRLGARASLVHRHIIHLPPLLHQRAIRRLRRPRLCRRFYRRRLLPALDRLGELHLCRPRQPLLRRPGRRRFRQLQHF